MKTVNTVTVINSLLAVFQAFFRLTSGRE